MEHAHAHHGHEDLVIGNAGRVIHRMQAVEQSHDFLSVEERNRRQNWAA